MLPLPRLSFYISPYLRKIDEKIESIISPNFINKIAQNIAFGGKRIRPTILILISKMLGGRHEESFLKSAIAIELIHLASLLHDDVIDEGKQRHGKQTAHILLGNQQVILGGDYLFAESFKIVAETENIQVIKAIARVSGILASGELLQLQAKITHETSLENYFEIIYKKTASLFEASTGIASIIQGNSSPDAFEFGKNIGMTFQIIDDIIDYTSKETGKTQGGDFAESKITLPIILASQKVSARKKLTELFLKIEKTTEDFAEVKAILNETKALEECQKIAFEYCEKAKSFISKNSKEGELMLEIMEFFLKRTF
jgi:octaprenyl-diphosphate synthase